jgi:hypothetical protein
VVNIIVLLPHDWDLLQSGQPPVKIQCPATGNRQLANG